MRESIWYRNGRAIALKVGRLNYTLPLALVPLLPASQIVHGYRLTNAATAASLLTRQRQPINPHQAQMFCMKRNRFGQFAEVMLEGF